MKVKAMSERILAINPQCNVRSIEEFFTATTSELILDQNYDYVIDAIDSLQNKCVLAAKCQEKNIPLIINGGAAGKRNPAMIKVDDLGLACNDSLLFSLRKRLRQEFSFPSGESFTRSKKQKFKHDHHLRKQPWMQQQMPFYWQQRLWMQQQMPCVQQRQPWRQKQI